MEFRRAVAQGLLTYKQKKNPSPQKPKFKNVVKVHFPYLAMDNTGVHWPTFVEKIAQCEVCSSKGIESRPFSVCSHCKIHLCTTEKKIVLHNTMR